MSQGWINGRDGDALHALVVQEWRTMCDQCGDVEASTPPGFGHCCLCHQLIDLALPRTHRWGSTMQHLDARARHRHHTREQQRDVRRLRLAHLACNAAAHDDPPPARPVFVAPFFRHRFTTGERPRSSLSAP